VGHPRAAPWPPALVPSSGERFTGLIPGRRPMHCFAGLGRAGMLAAMFLLLVAHAAAPEQARPGSPVNQCPLVTGSRLLFKVGPPRP